MIVTVWRHGEAECGANDRLRQLTSMGRDDVSAGCVQFRAACNARGITPPQRILHSPWVRTIQTAKIIAAVFGPCTVAVESALRPDSDVPAVDAAICADGVQEHIVLVSHQPLVSRVVDHYLGGLESMPFLTPGGLITMSLDRVSRGGAKLLFWALPPTYEEGI